MGIDIQKEVGLSDALADALDLAPGITSAYRPKPSVARPGGSPTKTPKQQRKVCESCGRIFVYTPSPKGGRPRVYCDSTCTEWSVALTRVNELKWIMINRFTPSLWMTVRSEWWGWCNDRAWNRGVPKDKAETAHSIRRRQADKAGRR